MILSTRLIFAALGDHVIVCQDVAIGTQNNAGAQALLPKISLRRARRVEELIEEIAEGRIIGRMKAAARGANRAFGINIHDRRGKLLRNLGKGIR